MALAGCVDVEVEVSGLGCCFGESGRMVGVAIEDSWNEGCHCFYVGRR